VKRYAAAETHQTRVEHAQQAEVKLIGNKLLLDKNSESTNDKIISNVNEFSTNYCISQAINAMSSGTARPPPADDLNPLHCVTAQTIFINEITKFTSAVQSMFNGAVYAN